MTTYEINIDFFKKWSPAMAWVLGIIVSDGCICANKKKNQYQLDIPMKDKDILIRIRKAMGSNHPITLVKGLSYWTNKPKEIYWFRVVRKEMVKDLMKLGVTPHKSKTIQFPPIPRKYLSHFIRGVFDGDGSVHARKVGRKRADFTTGSVGFANGLSDKLNESGIPTYILTRNRDSLTYQVVSSAKIWDWMYKDKSQYFGDRKFNKVREYIKSDCPPEWVNLASTR